MQLNITLTEEQQLALEYVVYDIEDWATNFIAERARSATDEIVKLAVEKCLSQGIAVPETKKTIIELAYSRGWIVSAINRTKI